MIIALVILDRSTPLIEGKAPCFLTVHEETLLERLIGTVMRGPFGGTIVAASPELASTAQEQLRGFAVQFVAGPATTADKNATLRAGLKAAAELRARWEKAMSAAAARFSSADSATKKKGKDSESAGGASPKSSFSTHRGDRDVKIRGLARSFDRDGVMLFSDRFPAMTLELQAQVVEAYGREGADKGALARPIAQAVHQGQRGYPVILGLDAAREAEELSRESGFDDWLLQQAQRIQDVKTDAWGAVARLNSAEDYADLCRRLEK